MGNSKRDWYISIGIAFAVFFLYLPGLNYHNLLGEYWYYTPLRILEGQIVGQDFHITHGFLRYYLWALIYKIFGASTIAIRILAPITLGLLSGCGYLVARTLQINRSLSLVCAFVVLHTMTATYAVDFFLPTSDRHVIAFIGILVFHRLLFNPNTKNFLIFGLYCAIAISYTQDIGVYFIAAYLAFTGILYVLIVTDKFAGISKRRLLTGSILALCGFAIYMIPLLAYLFKNGNLIEVYNQLFVIPAKVYNYGHLSFNNIGSLLLIPQSLSVQDIKFSFLILRFFLIIGLYAGIGIWFLKRFSRSANISTQDLFLAFVLIYSMISTFTALRAFDSQHVTFVSQPFYLLAAWTLQRIYPAIWRTVSIKSFSKAVLASFIALNFLFSGIIVIKVLAKTYTLKSFEFTSVHAPNIRVVDTPELRDYVEALRYLQNTVPENEAMFSIEDANGITNFLINRPNRTEYDITGYLALNPSFLNKEMPKILDDLSEVKFILIQGSALETVRNSGSDLIRNGMLKPFKYYFSDYYDYVYNNYYLEKIFGKYEIWIRK